MRSFCLTVCRFSISAWVGAAVLFVVVGIGEVHVRQFDSEIRDLLVAIRFPFYYAFGFVLLIVSLLSGLMSRNHTDLSSKRSGIFLGLVTVALLAMLADYVWVYLPLVEMITPAGEKARPAEFVTLHELTKWINLADVTLCLIAALVISRPAAKSSEST